MSYTEYMRRKAAVSPVVINNQKLRTASELTQERRLMASAVFPSSGGVNSNIVGTMRGDLLLTETAVNPKQPTSFVKQTGKPKNASDFTSYAGAHAIQNGNTFANGNTQNAGKIQTTPCVSYTVYPVVASLLTVAAAGTGTPVTAPSGNTIFLPTTAAGGIIVGGSSDPKLSTLSFTGTMTTLGAGATAIQIGFSTSDYTTAKYYMSINASNNVTVIGPTGSSVLYATTPANSDTFSATLTSSSLTFTYMTGSKTFNGPFNYNPTTSFYQTFIGTVATTAWGFSIANTIQKNASPVTIDSPTPYITGTTTQVKANTVARSGSDFIRERLACQKAQGEQHIASELGPSVFKDDTISRPHFNKQYLAVSATYKAQVAAGVASANLVKFCDPNTSFPAVEHIHSVTVNRQGWSGRNTKSQIPVFNVPSKDYPVPVAGSLPNCFTGKNTTGVFSRGAVIPAKHVRYVEKHHGNDLLSINPRKPLFQRYQIPAGTPAHLKINDANLVKTPNM